MRFLIDAQLPRRIAHALNSRGHDAIHTLDLPGGNRTPDAELLRIADQDDRALVTKDGDFVDAFLIHDVPRRLLLVATGIIRNAALERLLMNALTDIDKAFEENRFVEFDNEALRVRW